MAISFMRALEGVTGMDILGRKEEREKEEARKESVRARMMAVPSDPWARWRALEKGVLQQGGVAIIDGATGTEIERLAGAESMNAQGWSCSANFTYPDVVKEVHHSYLAAGADIIISNTYATNGNVMQGAGMGRVSDACTKAAVRLAQEARSEFLEASPEGCREPLVAGSMSCHPPKQELGSCFDGGEWPDPMAEVENNNRHCKLLAEAGVDVIFVEMVWETEHGERAVKAACDTHLPVVLCLSCPIQEDTSVMTAVRGQLACNQPLKLGGLGDVTLSEAIKRFTAGRPNIVAVCIHHTPLTLMPHAVSAARAAWPGHLGAYPEHGKFEMPHWQYERLSTEELVGHAEVWVQGHQLNMVGGCCGIGPKHIRALSAAFSKPPAPASAGPGPAAPLKDGEFLTGQPPVAGGTGQHPPGLPAVAEELVKPAHTANLPPPPQVVLPPPPGPLPADRPAPVALEAKPHLAELAQQPLQSAPPSALPVQLPAPPSLPASGESRDDISAELAQPAPQAQPQQQHHHHHHHGHHPQQHQVDTAASGAVVSASVTPVSGGTPSPDLVGPTPSVSEVTTKTPSPEPASPEDIAPHAAAAPAVVQQDEKPFSNLGAGVGVPQHVPTVAPVPEATQAAVAVAPVLQQQHDVPAVSGGEARSLSPLSLLMSGLQQRPPAGPSNALAAFAAMSEQKFPAAEDGALQHQQQQQQQPAPLFPTPPAAHFDPLAQREVLPEPPQLQPPPKAHCD